MSTSAKKSIWSIDWSALDVAGERFDLSQVGPPPMQMTDEEGDRLVAEAPDPEAARDLVNWYNALAREGRSWFVRLPDPDPKITYIVELEATMKLSDDLTATITLDVRELKAKWTGIALRSPQGTGIDARLMARIGLADIRKRVSMELPHVLGLLRPGQASQFVGPRPGRRGYGDAQYALWARDYVLACEEDISRPVALLVKRNPNTTAADWRRWLAEAQRRGLLVGRPPQDEGRAGGRLSAKAKRLLKEIGS